MIRVHGIFPYDRSGKVRWLLTELGVAHESRYLDRDKGEHEGPEFLRLNPMGRVPVVEHDDTVIFESGGICAYLADLYLNHPLALAPALTSPDRARYQQWVHFAGATIDTMQTRIMIIEDIPAGEVRTQKETVLLADLHDAADAIDRVLARGQYLLGERFSAADILVSYHLFWLDLWPELAVVLKRFPRVGEYVARMRERPAAVQSAVFSYEE